MRERSRKLEKGIGSLLGDYKPIHVTSSNTQSSKLILKAMKPVLKTLQCLDSVLWVNQMGKKVKINCKTCKGRFEFRTACWKGPNLDFNSVRQKCINHSVAWKIEQKHTKIGIG
jgi:hypothetical protein